MPLQVQTHVSSCVFRPSAPPIGLKVLPDSALAYSLTAQEYLVPPQPIFPTTVSSPVPTVDSSVYRDSVPCHPPFRSSESDGSIEIPEVPTPVKTASPSVPRIQDPLSEIVSDVLANDPVLDVTSDDLRQEISPPTTPEKENLASELPKESQNR